MLSQLAGDWLGNLLGNIYVADFADLVWKIALSAREVYNYLQVRHR
jgi:hypothetical protein